MKVEMEEDYASKNKNKDYIENWSQSHDKHHNIYKKEYEQIQDDQKRNDLCARFCITRMSVSKNNITADLR